jgi:hypothetical protein
MVHPSQEDFRRLWGRLMGPRLARCRIQGTVSRRPRRGPEGALVQAASGMNVQLQVVESGDTTQYPYLPVPGETAYQQQYRSG